MIEVNGYEIKLNRFPDNTLLMKYTVNSSTCVIRWKYEGDEELFALYCLKRHIDNFLGFNVSVTLKLDYIPNARQDRVKNKEDVFTLKYFSELINSMNFDCVEVLDPHSNVSCALIDNLVVKSPAEKIAEAYMRVQRELGVDKPLLMFYPDEGACKRYTSMFTTPHAFGIKKRNWEDGQIVGLSVAGNTELIPGSNILIVDDICSKGGTFFHSATRLKELGAKNIYLFVSHCENTIVHGKLLDDDLIEKIYTTDSLLTIEHEKIEILE